MGEIIWTLWLFLVSYFCLQAVSYEEYPHEFYPMNCEGQFYLFNTEVVIRLLQVMCQSLFFKYDGIFILFKCKFIHFNKYIIEFWWGRKNHLQAFERRGRVIYKIDDVFITGILAEEAKVRHMWVEWSSWNLFLILTFIFCRDIGDLIQHDKSRFLYQILEDDMK